MRKVTVLFFILLITVTFCACSDNELCGEWVSLTEGNTVIFDAEGTFILNFWDGDSANGTFVVDKADENGNVCHYVLTLCDSEGRKQSINVKTDGDEMTMAGTIYKKR